MTKLKALDFSCGEQRLKRKGERQEEKDSNSPEVWTPSRTTITKINLRNKQAKRRNRLKPTHLLFTETRYSRDAYGLQT